MALPKSVCDNCVNTECLWRAPTGGNDPPVMICPDKIDKPQTNADRIRAMTDAELADYAYKTLGNCCCPPKREFEANNCMGFECLKCWLDWLKQEVSDGT